MNLQENISRIREMMGLKLLVESTIGDGLVEIFKTLVKNSNTIEDEGLEIIAKNLKNVAESEASVAKIKLSTYLDEVINGTRPLSKNIEELIMNTILSNQTYSDIVRKLIKDTDPFLVSFKNTILDDEIKNLIKNISSLEELKGLEEELFKSFKNFKDVKGNKLSDEMLDLYKKDIEELTKFKKVELSKSKNVTSNNYENILNNFKKDYELKKLKAGDYGGGRNYGVYDYDGKIVKVTQPKRSIDMNQIEEFSKRLSDMKNVYYTKKSVKLNDGNYAMIMDKANGISGDKLSKSQIDSIPEEHWVKFEKDVRELSNRGVQVDLTKRDNLIYDSTDGFKFIDMAGISVDKSGTDKFFMKDGVQYYYPFEQYRFFPKKFEGGKKMFENIPQLSTVPPTTIKK